MSRRFDSFVLAAAVAAFLTAPASAGSNTVTVPGTADVWLSGQPNGTVLQGAYASPDVAPTNSPVLASAGLNMTAGSYLTFSATGTTDYNGCAASSPDGGGACGTFTTPLSFFGISTITAPLNSVVGVFIGDGVPSGTAPGAMSINPSATTISPQLNQVFYIGDGLTGTGSGTVQRFVIPAGATRLYLGSFDGIGANYNNSGSFSVTVSDATTPATTPVTPTFALLLTGLLLAAAGGYFLKRRTSAV